MPAIKLLTTDRMRILHFSTDDITGGAAKAAYRLHLALREAGTRSRMLVRRKKSEDDDVVQAPPPASQPWSSRFARFLPGFLPDFLNADVQHIPGPRRSPPVASYTFNFDLEPKINFSALLADQSKKPDVVCLHWVTGLLDSRAIRRLSEHYRCPIVWVMADQEPMTGGCHYSFGCDGFTRQCGSCPQLNSTDDGDHSRATWRRKMENLAGLPICFIAPTSWGREQIRRSSLFNQHRVELLPYPIDAQTFRPFDQRTARDLLHLPQDKKVLFFGATYLEDRRKGMTQLIESLSRLADLLDAGKGLKRDDVFLLVAGLNGKELMNRLPLTGKYVGHLNDDLTLALAYQAADVFICPSIEDAGPMMIPEAMMCGTPVIAFNTGGAPDLIETMKTGYLARRADSTELANGIACLLAADNGTAMRVAAREAALRLHQPQIVAARHLKLYQELARHVVQ